MRLLERGQPDKERYRDFLEREQKKRGRFCGLVTANLLTAWARITEENLGVPLEPGQIYGELKDEQPKPKS